MIGLNFSLNSLYKKLQCGCIIQQWCFLMPVEICIPSFLRTGDCYMSEIHTVKTKWMKYSTELIL